MLRRITLTTAFGFLMTSLFSQAPWRIEKLGVEEGLSQGYIYVIHQDKKGFVWVGTHGGLNRYDGYEFKHFQHAPFDAQTLGDNSVFFLKEDERTGKFWIGGSSCLNEFDPVTFINTRYYYNGESVEFADGIFVNPQELLLACEYDVLLFNTRTKMFTQVPVYDENGQRTSVSRVENTAADKKGNIMVMSRSGIFFYDAGTKTCRRKTAGSPDFSAFYYHEVFHVLHDSHGFYWIATNKKGLIRFNAKTGALSTLPLPPGLHMEALRFDVVTEDSKGFIWAGSSHGLFQINPVSLEYTYFASGPNSHQLSHPEINVVQEGKDELMWIGTVGGGINKLIPKNSGFKHIELAAKNSGSNTGTYIMGLQQLGNDVWFNNIWDQVGKVNITTGAVSLLPKSNISGYSWYSEGSIVSGSENEIVLLNGENAYRIGKKQDGKTIIRRQAAPGLFHLFTTRTGKTYSFVKAAVKNPYQQSDTIYGNQFFFDAVEDLSGQIWIGTSKGLLGFHPQTNNFTTYQHNYRNKNSLASDFIYSLAIDDTGQQLWMAAYHGGLCMYDMTLNQFRHYGKEDGLPDNTVYAIEKDRNGNFWLTTNAGISMYDVHKKSFRNFSVQDGLLNHEFNRRSGFQNKDGWIFFGGISGIDYFHPDSIIKTSTTPALDFTGFRIFNTNYIPHSKNKTLHVDLQHNQHYLTVDFAALEYRYPQSIQYAYRLNNSEWITTGNRHTLSFSNLPVGKHQLYVRSGNAEGTWANNEISCIIIVHPAWWQTAWFGLAAAGAGIGLLVLAIRLYYRRKLEKQKQVLEKQQAIEKERTRIATDMHDDLGAGLSRIKFLSETIGIKKQQHQPIEEDISKIRAYSHEMIDKMGEIVWALNEKNDSLNDLLSYTRSYAVEYLQQEGIACTVALPNVVPSIFVSGEFRRNIFLSVKEVLHNIVKHAAASNATISIAINKDLKICIEDDGCGFDVGHTRALGNGLSNIKKRMHDLTGNVELFGYSGTTVVLTAPLPQ